MGLKHKNKKICIAGFSFQHNYGDVLMFMIYIKWLNDQDYEPYLYQPCEALLAEIELKGLKFKVLNKKYDISKDMTVIFIGGGYFGITEYYQFRFQYNFIMKNKLYLLGKYLIIKNIDFHILGVEIGPGLFPFALNRLKPIIKKSKTLIVRNVESKYQVQSYRKNIEVLPDVVFAKTHLKDKPNENIALHLSSRLLINFWIFKEFHLAMIDFCKFFSKINITVFFDNFLNTKQKKRLCILKEFYAFHGITFHEHFYNNIDTIDNVLKQNSFIITNKLHCGIKSWCNGNYTICVGSGPKLVRLYKGIGKKNHYLNIIKGRKRIKSFLINHYKNLTDKKIEKIDIDIAHDAKKYKKRLIEIAES